MVFGMIVVECVSLLIDSVVIVIVPLVQVIHLFVRDIVAFAVGRIIVLLQRIVIGE